MSAIQDIPGEDLPVNGRDVFLRLLIRNLAGALEDVVGLEDAEGFISVVGEKLGNEFNDGYLSALGVDQLNKAQIAEALVDLKRRINGDFYIIEQDEDRIVLGNRRCPFEEMVEGHPSMCMMTSNVFGKIAAENTGYARVTLEKTIALGHGGCHVTVHFTPTDELGPGQREYFKSMV